MGGGSVLINLAIEFLESNLRKWECLFFYILEMGEIGERGVVVLYFGYLKREKHVYFYDDMCD